VTDDDVQRNVDNLLRASDDLDKRLAASPDFRRMDRMTRNLRLMTIALAAMVVVVAFVSWRAYTNTDQLRDANNELNRTQTAIHVYCEQTNIYNREARAKLPALFPRADQATIDNIAKSLFPDRTCTIVPPGTQPTSSPPTDVLVP
jgi:hypothetical protein